MDTPIAVAQPTSPARTAPLAPGGLPLLGHALQLVRRPLEFVDALRAQGDVVRIQLGPSPAYVVTTPELTRTVLVTEAKSFPKGGPIIDALRIFFRDGIGTSIDEDLHRRHRRLMQPMFNRVHIAARGDAMIGLVGDLTRQWRESEPLTVFDEMNNLVFAAFLVALFGTGLSPQVGRDFPRLMPVIMRGTIRHAVLPGWLADLPMPSELRFRASMSRLRQLVDETIDRYQQSAGDGRGQDAGSGGPELFRTLMEASDSEATAGLDRDELHDEVITLLGSNMENTGTTLAWALYEISRNPDVERKLHAEIDAVCGDRALRTADLPSLDYTRRIIQETMRLYGPVWLVTRRTAEAVTLGGYHIPGDTDVAYSPYLMQHDPAAYPDPERFDPDRWAPDRVSASARNNYMVFGAGTRQCIGESFAWVELVIILAVITSRWRLTATSDRPVKPVAHVTVNPGKLLMTPRLRARP
jgi:cytochrome P450